MIPPIHNPRLAIVKAIDIHFFDDMSIGTHNRHRENIQKFYIREISSIRRSQIKLPVLNEMGNVCIELGNVTIVQSIGRVSLQIIHVGIQRLVIFSAVIVSGCDAAEENDVVLSLDIIQLLEDIVDGKLEILEEGVMRSGVEKEQSVFGGGSVGVGPGITKSVAISLFVGVFPGGHVNREVVFDELIVADVFHFDFKERMRQGSAGDGS